MAVTTLRNLLAKHSFDDRYSSKVNLWRLILSSSSYQSDYDFFQLLFIAKVFSFHVVYSAILQESFKFFPILLVVFLESHYLMQVLRVVMLRFMTRFVLSIFAQYNKQIAVFLCNGLLGIGCLPRRVHRVGKAFSWTGLCRDCASYPFCLFRRFRNSESVFYSRNKPGSLRSTFRSSRCCWALKADWVDGNSRCPRRRPLLMETCFPRTTRR